MMIQMYVCRTDYDFSRVVLCGGELAREFWQMVVVHDSDRSAYFPVRTSPAFTRDVFAHEIPDRLRTVRSVFGVVTALKFREQVFRNGNTEPDKFTVVVGKHFGLCFRLFAGSAFAGSLRVCVGVGTADFIVST